MNGLDRHVAPLVVLLFLAVPAAALADVKSDLLKRGVRVSTTSASLSGESEVASQLKEVTTLKRKLVQAASQLNDHKKGDAALDKQIEALNQQLVGLNAELANVQDVVQNNRLVGAIGSMQGQLRLAYDSREKRTKQEAALHEQLSVARDGMLTHVADMRKAADDVARKYYDADPETLELLSQLNMQNSSKIALQPSSTFLANLRKLEELEGDILSEDIKLRREGNTYWASVKLNGENNLDMVVDSGASIVLLSYEDAAKAGIKAREDSPKVRLGVADGRTTTGRQTTIKSLQLGQFTAENVECVVLDAASGKAAPLLGMTFLGRFKFQLDGGKSTLSMIKVKDSSSASEKPNRGTKLPSMQLIRSDWKLVPAEAKIPCWNDRPYQIQSIPRELNGASLVVRKVEDSDWPAGEIIAYEPTKVSIAIRTTWFDAKARKQVEDVNDDDVAKLTSQGWQSIDGFTAYPEPKERWKWKWVLLQKRFDPGPIVIPALASAENLRVLFFFEPAGKGAP